MRRVHGVRMGGRRWRSLVGVGEVACVLVTVPGLAGAQEAQERAVLDLEQAFARAVEHNPGYQRAVNELGLAGPEGRRAWGSFLPTLDVGYATNQSFTRQQTAFDEFGRPVENPQEETVYASSANQSLSLSVPLFRGGERFHALGRARAQADQRRRAGEVDLNAVLAGVWRQFLEAQKSSALLELEEELLLSRERDLEMTRRLYELASKNRSDLLGVEVDVEAQRGAVREASGLFQKALLALRNEIGDPQLEPVDVSASEPVVFEPSTLSVSEIVTRALERSPSLGRAEAATRVSQAGLKMARAGRWPEISLGGSLFRRSFGRDQAALFDVYPRDLSGGLSLNVSVPVFSGFQTSFAIAEADVAHRNSMEELREAELQLETDVRSRYVDLETAWTNLQEGVRRQELAEERVRILREEYRLAGATFEELQSATRDEANARRTAIEQRYVFASALVDLYEAAGIVAEEAGIDPPELQDR